MLRVVVVVGEVAAFDEQHPAVAREQTGGKAVRLEVANRHVHAAFEQDADSGPFQRVRVADGARALQRRAIAFDSDVAGANDEPGVESRSLLQHEIVGDDEVGG